MLTDDTLQPRPHKIARYNPPHVEDMELETLPDMVTEILKMNSIVH